MSATQPNTTTNSGGMWNVVEQQQLLSPAGVASLASTGGTSGPAITSITVTDIGFNNLDDTAVNSSNAYIKITGTGFASTSNVYVAGTQVAAANVTYTSATELRVALPTLTVGSNSVVSVFNSSGSGAIYAGNLFCSGFPTVTTSTYSASSLSISTQLLATGDGTLTYALQGGSSLPAGLTLNSNGLITGTASGDSVTSFTVLVNDSQNQTTQQSITFTISSSDPYFKYTTLLLQADNTSNNSVNGTLVDSSTNAYTITPTGTPATGTINPFGSGAWSNYFDGSGDYVNNGTSASTSGNFTLEAWVYRTAAVTSVIIGLGSETTGRTYMYVNSAGTLNWGIFSVGDWDLGGSVPLHTWNHIAICRVGTTVTGYINGTALATTTTSNQTVGNSGGYGVGGGQNGSNLYYGYISNARIVFGTAVYTASFTPSTTPLTAIANTVLLTCQSSYFKDNSSNAYTLTVNGNPTVERFNPFGVNGIGYEVSADTIAGSTYFSGSSQYLTVSNPGGLGSDFTLEFWMYAPSNGGGGYIFNSRTGGGSGDGIDISGQLSTTTAGVVLFNSTSITSDTWTHVAFVRSGPILSRYINGTLNGSINYGTAFTGADFYIGGSIAGNAGYFSGYISNFRHTTTALYTSTFTPSTTPLTAVANTRLLTCQNSQSVVTDESTNKFTITTGGTPLATAKTPFTLTDTSTAGTTYSGSTFFNGTTDYLSLPSSTTNLNAGSSDFTIDGWLYTTASGQQNIAYLGGNTGTYAGIRFEVNGGGTRSLQILATTDGSNWGLNYSAGSLQLNAWNHIALCRSGNSWYMFINGVQAGSTQTFGGTMYGGTYNQLGAYLPLGGYFSGFMSNMRFIKGTALYTTTFTPPTTPAQPIANTQFLLSGKNSAIFDGTMQNNIRTIDGAKVKTSPYKYGTGSMYFDGSGDYVLVPPTRNLEFGSGDFTIEFWWYPTSTARQALYHGSYGGDWSIGIDYSSVSTNQKIGIWASSNGSSWNLINSDNGGNGIGTTTITQNSWNHIAFVRSGTTWMLFVNGSRDLNLTGISGTLVDRSGYSKVIGNWWTNAAMAQTNGYLDDFRITKGYARYTANFSVPDAALKNK